jgi:hypothetical protein
MCNEQTDRRTRGSGKKKEEEEEKNNCRVVSCCWNDVRSGTWSLKAQQSGDESPGKQPSWWHKHSSSRPPSSRTLEEDSSWHRQSSGLHKKISRPIFPLERLEGEERLCDAKRQVFHGRYIIPQQQRKQKLYGAGDAKCSDRKEREKKM